MLLLRRDPANRILREMDWMSSALNHLSRRGEANGSSRAAFPQINIWEDEQTLHAELELPGFDSDKIDISVTEGSQLTISGFRPPVEVPGAVWHRKERGHGHFSRTIALPTMIDASRVEAILRDGVLQLSLPKAEAAKPRKIAIQGS